MPAFANGVLSITATGPPLHLVVDVAYIQLHGESFVESCPNWETLFHPQQFTLPVASIAQVCPYPAASAGGPCIATNEPSASGCGSVTGGRVLLGSTALSPIAPDRSWPQQYTL